MKERQENTGSPLSVFISSAHEDEPLRQQLETHLSLLRREGRVTAWYDHQIMPGEERAQVIDKHLVQTTLQACSPHFCSLPLPVGRLDSLLQLLLDPESCCGCWESICRN